MVSLDDADLGGGKEVGNQFAVFEEEIVEASAGARGGDLFAFERGDDGAENLGRDEVVEHGGIAFLAEPVEDVRAEGVIANREIDLLFQIEMAPLVLKQPCDLRDDAAGAAKQKLDGPRNPFLAERLGEGGKDPFLLGGADVGEDVDKVLFFVAQHLGKAGGAGGGSEFGLGANLVAGKEQLEGGSRAQLQALARGLLGGDDDGAERLGIGKPVEILDDGIEGGELIFQLPGAEELLEKLIARGRRPPREA